MKKMVACCGLDCEKCDAYIATINNDDDLRKETAKTWSHLNNVEILPENINCLGCRAEGVKTFFCESLCNIRKCAFERGVDTCGECTDRCDCPDLAEIANNSDEARKNVNIEK